MIALAISREHSSQICCSGRASAKARGKTEGRPRTDVVKSTVYPSLSVAFSHARNVRKLHILRTIQASTVLKRIVPFSQLDKIAILSSEARSGGRASHAEAEVIAGGVGEVLCDAEVAFGGLDGGVSQRNLDLFEGGVTLVGEFGEGATEVMGSDFHPDPLAVRLDHLKNGLRGHAGADDAVTFVDGAQQRGTKHIQPKTS